MGSPPVQEMLGVWERISSGLGEVNQHFHSSGRVSGSVPGLQRRKRRALLSLGDALTALSRAEKGNRRLDAKREDPGAESKQGRSSDLKPEELLGAAYLEMKVILNYLEF